MHAAKKEAPRRPKVPRRKRPESEAGSGKPKVPPRLRLVGRPRRWTAPTSRDRGAPLVACSWKCRLCKGSGMPTTPLRKLARKGQALGRSQTPTLNQSPEPIFEGVISLKTLKHRPAPLRARSTGQLQGRRCLWVCAQSSRVLFRETRRGQTRRGKAKTTRRLDTASWAQFQRLGAVSSRGPSAPWTPKEAWRGIGEPFHESIDPTSVADLRPQLRLDEFQKSG
mmetsp:Transcript_8776/g.30965  ORF Transcript_8776/g.30965 Transcript_8776/m.30965 type:complete len:224 (+) Transcript_8776:596-1267(+)